MSERPSSNTSLFQSAISIMQRDIFIYVLSIATGVLIARVLGPDILGVWVLLSLISAYAEGFGRLKTDVASVYMIGSKKAKEEVILFSSTLFALTSGFLLTLILLSNLESVADILFKNADSNYTEHLFFIVLIIPFEFLLYNYTYFYIALEKVSIYNRIKVLQAVINFIIIFGLIIIFKFDLWAIVIAKVASVLVPLLYSYLKTERKRWMNLGARWSFDLSREILKYAFNFYIVGILGNINRLTTKTIAASFFNPSQLAFYNQGESSGRFINVIPNSLATILYPRISSTSDYKESLEISCQSFRLTLMVLSLAGTLLYLVANPLIVFLYGEIFKPTAEILQLAIPGFVIGSSCLTLKSYFEGRGEASIIPKLQTFPVILQIPLSYYMISLWGLYGAGLSLSIGTAIYGLVILVAFMWKNKLSFSAIFPNSRDFKTLLIILKDYYKK